MAMVNIQPCAVCIASGGYWIVNEKGARRCDCARGRTLSGFDRMGARPIDCEPVLTAEEMIPLIEFLASIPFFPNEPGSRGVIGEDLRHICRNFGEALWLVNRMRELYPRKWPGYIELRIVYCAHFGRPLDGWIETGSDVYPNGIPGEARPFEIEASPLLPAGHLVSADALLDRAVGEIANAKRTPILGEPLRSEPAPLTPIVTLQPNQCPVTQADIENARRQMRDEVDAALMVVRSPETSDDEKSSASCILDKYGKREAP